MGRDVELAYNGPSFAAPGIDTQVFTTGVRLSLIHISGTGARTGA